MTFLNPLLLFGIGAIAAPIIIHLFMNNRVKPMLWAAMRFLQASVLKNQKRMNIEDYLLLLLRCLVLALLALALARPAFRKGAAAVLSSRGSETTVIALDNSYSMAQNDGGASRFDQARQAAEQALDALPPGSAVAVLLFSDAVRAVIPEPTFDLNLARKIIREAPLSDRGTDVHHAVNRALDLLSKKTAAQKGLFLISDGQAAGWSRLEDIRQMLAASEVRARVVLVGAEETRDLCVSNVRLASALAPAGEAVQFQVEVSNLGASEAQNVPVSLSVDGEPPADQGVIDAIPAGARKSISLYARLREAGYHTVTGQIPPDHLPVDDRRTIALRAIDDARVLLVDGAPGAEPRESAVFFLRNALTPVPLAEREKHYIKTKTIAPAELEGTALGEFEAVVLADVAELTPGALAALETHVGRGGGLLIFPGPATNAAFYNEQLAKKRGLLPATLGEVRAAPENGVFHLQDKDYTHRIVSIWNTPAAGTLAGARFQRAYVLKPEAGRTEKAGEPRVVVSFADGAPAVMERTWGRGSVVLFSSTANSAWNDLALRPAFVPLIERTVGAILERQEERLNISVGGKFEVAGEAEWIDKDVFVAAPGESKGPGALRRLSVVEGVPLLRFEETDRAGAYDVTVKTEPPTTVKLAAQFNPAESDLTPLAQAQIDSLAPAATIIRWAPGMNFKDQLGPGRGGGGEFWVPLAFLGLLVACVEMGLAGIFSAPK